ncbi:cytochrome P450 2B19-like [Amphiura filiformis]|uniref:cytochrome P450 2B19-like n=1 Tax=Amphiura filiformis TaxID=82378 RepID=UPI003B21F0D7
MAESSVVLSMISGSYFTNILLLVVIIVSVIFFLSKKTNLPPGPWTLIPYIGFAPNIAYALYKGEPLYKFLTKLGNKYGQVYSFTALGMHIVVLNEYKAIREAFQDIKLNDRGENEMLVKILGRTNNKWDDMGPYRIFALACFRQFGVGTSRFEEPIRTESAYLVDELANLKGHPVDPTWHFNNAVSNIICKVVFGTRFELSDERFHRLTNLVNRQNELLGAGSLEILTPINIPSKAKQEMNEVFNELLEFINGMIENHRQNLDPDNLNDVIDLWLNEIRLHKSDDPNSFRHPDNMPGQILLLFLAGTDTTSNTLRWGSQYLVRYPKVQDRIHREIDTVVGRNRLPKLADKLNLPYTQAVIAEFHRIISLVPLSSFHVAGDTTTFRGYTIPKNTVVFSNLYAVMHSPEIWGDPEEFRPERFLDDEGNFHEPDEVIPFGIGRRVCLGEALARQELFIFFTHILHQFKFEKTSEDAPMPTLKPIDGLVLHPEPYKLRVIKRDATRAGILLFQLVLNFESNLLIFQLLSFCMEFCSYVRFVMLHAGYPCLLLKA